MNPTPEDDLKANQETKTADASAEAALETAGTTRETGGDAGDAETPTSAVETVIAGVRAEEAKAGEVAAEKVAPVADKTGEREATRHRVVRSAGIVSIAVMGSRVLGLVREQIMAAYFGAGFVTDAFNIAFRIPNLLRDLFAEGALSVAFVKTFTDYLEDPEKGEEAAWRLASLVMNALAVVLSVIVILGVIFSPQIVYLMTQFFTDGFSPEKAALAVTLTRIMFPFLLLVALAAVAMGVLNTKGRFGIPASASMMFNVGSIAGGLLFAYFLTGGGWTTPRDPATVPDAPAQWAITGMAIGTLIGGGLQFLVQVPSLMRVGFRFRPFLSFRDKGVRAVMRLMGPAVIGTAAVQVNVVINSVYASDIEGGVSWLGYAFRLMQLPIGIFGVAIATATVPAISRFAARKEIPEFRSTLASSLGLVFFLTLPAACGLVVLGRPIISLIYQRGAFTADATDAVAMALAAYSIGLTGYAAIKVLSPAFYTLNDARTPMIVSLASIGVNIVASYFLKEQFARLGYAHAGLALSTSIVALVNFAALLLLMRRRIGHLEGRRIFSSFVRIALASLALSIASYGAYRWLLRELGDATLTARVVETFAPIAVGVAVFLIAARLLRIEEMSAAVRAVAGRFKR